MAGQAARHSLSPLGHRLRLAQDTSGKSNRDVADALDVDVRQWIRWKSGDVNPKLQRLMEIARLFDRDLAWFFEDAA